MKIIDFVSSIQSSSSGLNSVKPANPGWLARSDDPEALREHERIEWRGAKHIITSPSTLRAGDYSRKNEMNSE